jgi:hypothetical protein
MKGGKPKMDYEKILHERLSDAENALKGGYNEQAAFDAALITMVLNRDVMPKADGIRAVQNPGKINYFDMAVDELKDAEKYWELYKKTGDDRFRQMAKQEIGHSSALSDMTREHGNAKDAETLNAKRHQIEHVIK